jgi:hypothetical protein
MHNDNATAMARISQAYPEIRPWRSGQARSLCLCCVLQQHQRITRVAKYRDQGSA